MGFARPVSSPLTAHCAFFATALLMINVFTWPSPTRMAHGFSCVRPLGPCSCEIDVQRKLFDLSKLDAGGGNQSRVRFKVYDEVPPTQLTWFYLYNPCSGFPCKVRGGKWCNRVVGGIMGSLFLLSSITL